MLSTSGLHHIHIIAHYRTDRTGLSKFQRSDDGTQWSHMLLAGGHILDRLTCISSPLASIPPIFPTILTPYLPSKFPTSIFIPSPSPRFLVLLLCPSSSIPIYNSHSVHSWEELPQFRVCVLRPLSIPMENHTSAVSFPAHYQLHMDNHIYKVADIILPARPSLYRAH